MLEWSLTFDKDRIVTNLDMPWDALARSVRYDGLMLFALDETAASLTAYLGDASYTLYSPSSEARFYRHFRSRTPLGISGAKTITYHAIGYILPEGRVLLEIGPDGNAVRHSFPLT